jgi:anti-anti-sigma factor
MAALSISVHRSPTATAIQVCGDVDVSAGSALRSAVEGIVDRGCREVTMDLHDVSFIDCAGLELLISVRKQLRAFGCRMQVGTMSHVVARLLTLTGSHHELAT